MKYLKKILRFVLPYRKYAFFNIFFNALYALFSTLGMLSILPMLEVLFKESESVTELPKWAGIGKSKDFALDTLNYYVNQNAENSPLQTLMFMVGFIISIFLFKNLFRYLALYSLSFLRNGILKDMRDEMYQKTTSLPLSFFSEHRKGDLVARISSDINEIQNSMLSVLELVVREPLTIVFTISAMLLLSPKLTLFVFIFIPVSGFLISLLGRKLKKMSLNVQKEMGIFLSYLDETLYGLKLIKSYNAEDYFQNRFENSTKRFYDFSNTLIHRQNLAAPISEFLGILTIGVLLIYGGKLVLIEQNLSSSDFIAYIALAYQILTPAKAISKASYKIKKGNAAADRVLEILEIQSPIKDSKDAINKSKFEDKLTFSNVSFSYEKELVLKNINLEIPKGQTIAFVGHSGSGKSTLANLVNRFYEVTSGDISIDGISIKNLTKKSLRGLTSVVTQDSILFNGSIKSNLCLGEKYSEDQIIKALKTANAWEFVKKLPNQIHQNIGDSGNKLSGGQKQRLSIARAVLKNAPVLILDEATSALDSESEYLVQNALEKLMHKQTSIVIAHRLSTIKNADCIVVLKDGKIIEKGKHSELLAKNGNYKLLVDMQNLKS